MSADAELLVCDAGAIDYGSALALQERVREARQAEIVPDTMLVLEHFPPVYTRGRRSAPGELTMGEAWYAQRGITIFETKRGGKVTYHGPGQLVGYPIVHITDVVGYVRSLERALVRALAEVGIAARDRADEGPDYTGVWVEDRKIASIGVHVARGVAAHGFALNVDNDLAPFDWVIACGLPDVRMTSVAVELGLPSQRVQLPGNADARSTLAPAGQPAAPATPVPTAASTTPLPPSAPATPKQQPSGLLREVRTRVIESLASELGRRARPVSLSDLEERIGTDAVACG